LYEWELPISANIDVDAPLVEPMVAVLFRSRN